MEPPRDQALKISMKRITVLLALLAAGWGDAHAAPALTNSAPANRILMIDPSSMRVDAGKATLTIGALQRVDGVYSGDYKIKVFPWFLKNEKGRLAIVVSDESLAGLNREKSRPSPGPPPQRQGRPEPAHRGHGHAG